MISQTDNKLAFQNNIIENLFQNGTKERVFELARMFTQQGLTEQNKRAYQRLDNELTEAVFATAKKVGRRKHG